jgi:hypothetical protein
VRHFHWVSNNKRDCLSPSLYLLSISLISSSFLFLSLLLLRLLRLDLTPGVLFVVSRDYSLNSNSPAPIQYTTATATTPKTPSSPQFSIPSINPSNPSRSLHRSVQFSQSSIPPLSIIFHPIHLLNDDILPDFLLVAVSPTYPSPNLSDNTTNIPIFRSLNKTLPKCPSSPTT